MKDKIRLVHSDYIVSGLDLFDDTMCVMPNKSQFQANNISLKFRSNNLDSIPEKYKKSGKYKCNHIEFNKIVLSNIYGITILLENDDMYKLKDYISVGDIIHITFS